MKNQAASILILIFTFNQAIHATGLMAVWNQNGGTYKDSTQQSSRYIMSDSVVIDRLTRLTWQRAESTEAMNLTSALAYCAGRTTNQLKGWRVPNLSELQSLLDYTIQAPNQPMNPQAFGEILRNRAVWSSTPMAPKAGNNTWFVLFWSGGESLVDTNDALHLVRCVNSFDQVPLDNRYTTATELVTDRLTGLVWQKHSPVNVVYSYRDAVGYCNNIGLQGLNWRLPTIKELSTLVDYGVSSGELMMDQAIFGGEPLQGYWSSTPGADNQDSAWVVRFDKGELYSTSMSESYSVRCVTTAPPLLKTSLSFLGAATGAVIGGAIAGIGVKIWRDRFWPRHYLRLRQTVTQEMDPS